MQNWIKKNIELNEDGIVVPVILWWLGAPISLLLLLWLFGVL